jgi:Family of unknown function (DUF6328)
MTRAKSDGDAAVDDGRDESAAERRDRELIELLNELRVTLPGIQVLLAFMLTIPFSQRFPRLTPFQRDTFVVALLTITCATVLLITPTAYHRLRWRRRDKEHLLVTSNRLAIVGLALLGLGLAEVIFLIMEVLTSTPVAVVLSLATLVLVAGLWFVIPLLRGSREEDVPR